MNAVSLAAGLFSYAAITLLPLMTISPRAPTATSLPLSSTTRTSGPAGKPTVPGFRARGGNGLLAIWCDASVIPYASTSGARNTRSSSASTVGGIADDDERIKRSRLAATISGFFGARNNSAWCIVGTAVYHVGFASPSHAKNFSALNPGVQHTVPPAESGADSAAISP